MPKFVYVYIYACAKLSRRVFVRVSVLFPLKVVTTKGGFHSFTLTLSTTTGAFANVPFSPPRLSLALRASCSKNQSKASKLVFFVKRERVKSKTKMANNAPGRRTTRAQSSAGKKTSKTPPKSPPVSTNAKNTTKRKKKEEKEDLLQVEEIAKRVKRASIETKEEEKEGEKTKEKEETNEEEYAYAEINSVLKRLHFEARERRRTSMSP